MERFKRKLLAGIIYFGFGIVLIIIGSLLYRMTISMPMPSSWEYGMLGAFIWIIGGIFFISGVVLLDRSASIKRMKHRVKEIGEDSKKIVDYLKTNNSGITQFNLASVLQIDRTKLNKCLNHLEWLGVVEKRKISAEEMLFFYKKDY